MSIESLNVNIPEIGLSDNNATNKGKAYTVKGELKSPGNVKVVSVTPYNNEGYLIQLANNQNPNLILELWYVDQVKVTAGQDLPVNTAIGSQWTGRGNIIITAKLNNAYITPEEFFTFLDNSSINASEMQSIITGNLGVDASIAAQMLSAQQMMSSFVANPNNLKFSTTDIIIACVGSGSLGVGVMKLLGWF